MDRSRVRGSQSWGGDVCVELLDDGVHVVDVQLSNVSQLLNLICDLFTLLVGQVQVQLVDSGLDGVPSRQSVGKVDVSGQTEVRGVQDLVGGRIGQNGFGVDAGLVGEGTESGDRVVERNVHLDGLGHQVLQVSQLVQLVLRQDVVPVGRNHAGHQASQRSDSVSLSNAQHRHIDQASAALQRGVCVGNGASRVVVEVALDVAVDHRLQGSDQLVDLSGVGASHGVRDADPVDADLVDGSIDVQQVHQVGTERVLGREPDLDALGLDKLDHLHRRLRDVAHVLSVRVLSQELRRADHDVHAINTGLHGNSGVVHVAPDVRQDFGLQAQLADRLAVLSALLGGHRRRQLDVVDAEVVERLGDLDLLLRGEESVSKLLSLAQCRLDQLEVADVRQEVRGVGAVGVRGDGAAVLVLLLADLGES